MNKNELKEIISVLECENRKLKETINANEYARCQLEMIRAQGDVHNESMIAKLHKEISDLKQINNRNEKSYYNLMSEYSKLLAEYFSIKHSLESVNIFNFRKIIKQILS